MHATYHVLLAAFFSTDQSLTLADLGTVAGMMVPVAGAAWLLAKKTSRSKLAARDDQIEALKRRTRTLEEDLDESRKDAAKWKKERDREHKRATDAEAQIAEVKKKLAPYYHAYVKVKPLHDQAQKDLAEARELVKKLSSDVVVGGDKIKIALAELENARGTLEHRESELKRTAGRIKKALQLEGSLWNVKALQKVPKFRPLAERNRAIVSVVNLKGGVGKTTITAQTAVALARRGYRVLLIDLDLQGSLTNTFLSFEQTKLLSDEGKLLHHFLKSAASDFTAKIVDYTRPVFDDDASGGLIELVPTSDNLAYAELSLTLQWLLRQGDRDTRFLLRKALHLASLNQDYDVVLLDCPPLVNISCVNALAASDYVLVPTTLSRQATQRVPVLLSRFVADETFSKNINHDLKVLGIVANRTRGDQLNGPESSLWSQLGDWSHDAAGKDVKRFGSVIPEQLRELRDVETSQLMPDPSSKLAQVFEALAAELEKELPSGCRRSAKAPV